MGAIHLRSSLLALTGIVVVAISVPPTAMTATTDASDESPPEPQVSSASVNLRAFVARIDESLPTVLPVGGENRSLLLTEEHFMLGDRTIWKTSADGERVAIDNLSVRTFTGHVAGDSDSLVFVTINLNRSAIYGILWTKDRQYSLSTGNRSADSSEVLSHWYERPTPLPPPTPDETTQTQYRSLHMFHMDTSYDSSVDDASTRIVAAFQAQRGMWLRDVGIEQFFFEVEIVSAGPAQTTCGNELDRYRGILAASFTARPEYHGRPQNHQLISGADLRDPCVGLARLRADLSTADAASVVEGVDHTRWPFDSYDPDEEHDLAVLMGQELGHNYGAQHDEETKRCAEYWIPPLCRREEYNVMASENFGGPADRGLFFSSRSANEIRQHSLSHLPTKGTLANGGEMKFWDKNPSRGKLFTQHKIGRITEVCIFGRDPYTEATVAIAPYPGATVVHEVSITVWKANAWNCMDRLNLSWTARNLFIFKKSGDAWISYDDLPTHDSRFLNYTKWDKDPWRRGYRVTIE